MTCRHPASHVPALWATHLHCIYLQSLYFICPPCRCPWSTHIHPNPFPSNHTCCSSARLSASVTSTPRPRRVLAAPLQSPVPETASGPTPSRTVENCQSPCPAAPSPSPPNPEVRSSQSWGLVGAWGHPAAGFLRPAWDSSSLACLSF